MKDPGIKDLNHEFELLSSIIDELRGFLPTQPPLKDFIHHNTLHAFEDLPFYQAIGKASKLYNANQFMSSEFYKNPKDFVCSSVNPTKFKIRQVWQRKCGLSFDQEICGFLCKILANYLDQGVSSWDFKIDKQSLWDFVVNKNKLSYLSILPYQNHVIKILLEQSSHQAVIDCLNYCAGSQENWRDYIWDIFLLLPGWAGMFSYIENNPNVLDQPRNASLLDFLAIFLVVERCQLELNHYRLPVYELRDKFIYENNDFEQSKSISDEVHRKFEQKIYQPFLTSIAEHNKTKIDSLNQPDVQAIFCIDDRMCSLRRYLEESYVNVQTFGVAGFFGIDCNIKFHGSERAIKHCPLPVNPRKTIFAPSKFKRKIFHLNHNRQHNILYNWFYIHLIGFRSFLHLIFGMIWPRTFGVRRLDGFSKQKSIDVVSTTSSEDSYSVEEASSIVANVFRTIGLKDFFAKNIYVIGHGSSSANNPYFAAYDCGACSGRHGGYNAMMFAKIANDTRVRAKLLSFGIRLPDSTSFIAALYDTCADIVEFNEQGMTKDDGIHQKFISSLELSLEKNAKERCKNFRNTDDNGVAQDCLEHVYERSIAWYEPRPEYNHATNAFCIIADRRFTRGLNFERRAFLQSYDYQFDQDGAILSQILRATVPVCGGINLEYFFSRLDSQVYGSGSKLPQNVVGLFGVLTGLDSDLRTGLPIQMTEIHDPVRLMMIIEQETNVVDLALQMNPDLKRFIDYEWVHMVSYSPSSHKFFKRSHGSWVEYNFLTDVV